MKYFLKITTFLVVILLFSSCGEERATIDDSCSSNDECSVGYWCNPDTKSCEEQWMCQSSEDCFQNDPNNSWESADIVKCQSGVCIPKGCITNSDCEVGKICSGSECVDPPNCSMINSIEIVTPSPVLTEGSYKELKAVVLNRNGVPVVVPEDGISWQSSDTDVVSIDSVGNATGGSTSGTASITAHYSSCQVESTPLTVQNFGTLADGKLRVIVRDIEGGAVEGATIHINDGEAVLTPQEGYIEVDNSESANNISVFHNDYKYISALGLVEKDIIIYLSKALSPTKAGGVQGSFDFSSINGGQVELALAGTSLPGNILDLSFDLLLGEMKMTHIAIGEVFEQDAPLPSGLVFKMGTEAISDRYEVVGQAGDRALWGWGGKLAMADMIAIANDALGGGAETIDIGSILTEIIPYVQDFRHSLKPTVNIVECNKVQDVDDMNGDGDTTDLVPDFQNSSCFPENNMELSQMLSVETSIKLPNLPEVEGGWTDVALILNASTVEGKGMIPMGISAGSDSTGEGDTADGKVDDISLYSAPKYNGLEGTDSIIVALTMPIDQSSMDPNNPQTELPVKLSGIVKLYKNGVIPENIDLSGEQFLSFGEKATYNNTTREIGSEDIANATAYRVHLTSRSGQEWIVYSKTSSFNLPVKEPENFGADYKMFIYQAVKLETEDGGLDMDKLFQFNDNNLDRLVHLITAFSAYQLDLD